MKLIKRLLVVVTVLAIIGGVIYVLNEKFKSTYITVSDDGENAIY